MQLRTRLTMMVNPAQAQRTTAPQVDALLTALALMMVADLKRELYAKGRSGEMYFKTKAARKRGVPDHQASAPGEPPAIDTGRMGNSVMHQLGEVNGKRAAHVGAYDAAMTNPTIGEAYAGEHGFKNRPVKDRTVGSHLDYPYLLEVGTRRVKKRPWLRPIYDRYIANAQKYINKAAAIVARAASRQGGK